MASCMLKEWRGLPELTIIGPTTNWLEWHLAIYPDSAIWPARQQPRKHGGGVKVRPEAGLTMVTMQSLEVSICCTTRSVFGSSFNLNHALR
ncbi:hypothetical protein VTN31DRAFT_7254 [Thermomyces dupontii]|uniref:uncharacterized protein n=1 Tax=Talaromyces thermophilus TaxID=28565 RepID=UPI003743CE05